MTDFYPMVLAALAKLEHNTEQTRQALYQRARTTLSDRLRSLDPPLPRQRIMEERLAFEEAVRRAEADWQRGLVEHALLSKLADALEHDALPGEAPRQPPSPTQLSGALEQSPSGIAFAYREGFFVFAARACEADRAVAADPLVRGIRLELGYKSRELAARLERISDPTRYRDLLVAVRMFTRALGDGDAGAAPDIVTLWPLHLGLASHVEESSGGTSVPLEAEIFRALRDLVAASGPWIAAFPTARALEEGAGRARPGIVDAAAVILRSAAETALLGDDAGALVRLILEQANAGAAVRDKIGSWAVATAGNLGIAMLGTMARIVSGYGAGNIVEPPEAARRIERMVLAHEAQLLQVFSNLPEAVRNEMQAAIDAIRAGAEDDV